MAQRVQVYEEKKGWVPAWAWPMPLLLVLASFTYFLTQHPGASTTDAARVSQTAPVTAAGAYSDLGIVHFDTNHATLAPEGQATLQRAAAAMQGSPNVHLRLEGYTDPSGAARRNATLADHRAKNVADSLQGQGIERNRLTGAGFGASKPLETNATDQGKADYRRVELFSQQ